MNKIGKFIIRINKYQKKVANFSSEPLFACEVFPERMVTWFYSFTIGRKQNFVQFWDLILFNLFSNDLDNAIECYLSQLAVDSKLGGSVCVLGCRKVLKKDPERLDQCARPVG